ncbi:hypothetical protein [Massilia sp. SYSU DXS3249]
MPNRLLSRPRRGLLATAALCTALALSACGGDAGDKPPVPQPPANMTPTPPPVASGDSFFAYVASMVSSMLDTNEPVEIDAITETKPEDTEPQPVT